jgi:four helix bundle protein
MKKYKELKIWQKGIEIVKETYRISKLLPEYERFGLTSQMTRAAVSVPANIAEGSSRLSDKEYFRFLEIALGSVFELDTHLIVIREINFVADSELDHLFKMLEEEGKMINSFLSKLKR